MREHSACESTASACESTASTTLPSSHAVHTATTLQKRAPSQMRASSRTVTLRACIGHAACARTAAEHSEAHARAPMPRATEVAPAFSARHWSGGQPPFGVGRTSSSRLFAACHRPDQRATSSRAPPEPSKPVSVCARLRQASAARSACLGLSSPCRQPPRRQIHTHTHTHTLPPNAQESSGHTHGTKSTCRTRGGQRAGGAGDLAGIDLRVADNDALPPFHLVHFVQSQHELFRVLHRPDDVGRLYLRKGGSWSDATAVACAAQAARRAAPTPPCVPRKTSPAPWRHVPGRPHIKGEAGGERGRGEAWRVCAISRSREEGQGACSARLGRLGRQRVGAKPKSAGWCI